MAPKTRSTTAQEKTKVSFTVDGNPFSLLSSQPPNPSCPSISTRSAAPPRTPESPSSSPSSSPPSPSTSASPPPSPSLHDSAATEFFTISSRINSYSNWPHLSQTALAAAGFYHVPAGGEKDLVECAFCDIRWSEWPDKDYTIERLMEKHEDNCSWPEIMTDLYNHLPLFLPANTASSRTPNKIYTPVTPEAPKKPLTRIPHPSPPPLPIQKHNGPSPPQCPQLSGPQPQIQRPLPSQPTISTPKPRTYASVLASLPPTQPKRPHKTPPGVVLTIQDLAIRFKNKPSPFKQPQPTAQYGLVTTATNSLSKFLLAALPAFTRFLSDIHGEQFNWCEHTSGNSGFDKGFPYFGVE